MLDGSAAPALSRDAERLGWLDDARGVAALSVALMHLCDEALPRWRAFDQKVFNPGVFGVVVFFLVSGFVIPMSLERRGSLVAFAVSRVFRLYPLYWTSLIAVVALHQLGLGILMPEFESDLVRHTLWNATMFQRWAGVEDAVGLYWSLAFELAFYGATAVLFAAKLNAYSDWIVALGTVYFVVRGVLFPLLGLGACLDADNFLVLTFFVGTLWYRGFEGTLAFEYVAWITLAFVAAVAATEIVTFGVVRTHVDPDGTQPLAMIGAWAAAYAAFALLIAGRARAGGRVLPWLGRVSYSVYLLHGVLILVPLPLSPMATLVVRLVVLLPVCALSFRYVEASGIRLGRAVLRSLI